MAWSRYYTKKGLPRTYYPRKRIYKKKSSVPWTNLVNYDPLNTKGR